ncbi:hypothetical protein [Pedobacter caeni]|uniref:Uncharacterized protein n=1 Tax=Pedobacter caeni TaxID=288992 RepID=A0A1M4ZM03_9SPHI|nr:hypothetical protein [Pedobacter caeni]SHF19120.1 hypothetical protein SAMN04488522_102383 [Pedobacter caeni]
MKLLLFALTVITLSVGCNKKEEQTKTYVPRILTKNEGFNNYPKQKSDSLAIFQVTSSNREQFSVKFRDTTVSIQTDASGKNKSADKFSSAQFINTQKTCLLVQLADSTGLVAPSFLISLKGDGLEVISLYRASNGPQDLKYTTGINKVSAAGYLVDNDFFITNVNAKAYLIQRQNPAERIQGQFILTSPDRQTVIFLVKNALYQVHYPSGEVSTEPLKGAAPKDVSGVYTWIQNNYSFQKGKKGISFLKYNDDDRIVDIKEFR